MEFHADGDQVAIGIRGEDGSAGDGSGAIYILGRFVMEHSGVLAVGLDRLQVKVLVDQFR